MTLCMAWRSKNGAVHFASDSRYTVASNSYADVAIKVLSLPVALLNPAETGRAAPRTVHRPWSWVCVSPAAPSARSR